jgi:phage shock protein A
MQQITQFVQETREHIKKLMENSSRTQAEIKSFVRVLNKNSFRSEKLDFKSVV